MMLVAFAVCTLVLNLFGLTMQLAALVLQPPNPIGVRKINWFGIVGSTFWCVFAMIALILG